MLLFFSDVSNGSLYQWLPFGDHQGDLRVKAKTGPTAARIPSKTNREVHTPHDTALCRQRHRIENMFDKLKDWCRIHTRYCRCANSRRVVEMQIEAGLLASLAKKNKPGKYHGGTLLITIPLMRLPDDNWDAMAEKLVAIAEALPFDEIHAIDHRKTQSRIFALK